VESAEVAVIEQREYGGAGSGGDEEGERRERRGARHRLKSRGSAMLREYVSVEFAFSLCGFGFRGD